MRRILAIFAAAQLGCGSASSQPALRLPFDVGQWWGPATYDNHDGTTDGRDRCIDFWFIMNQTESHPTSFQFWIQDGSNSLGKNVRAAHDGVVEERFEGTSGGYGKYIRIRANAPDQAYKTIYAHLSDLTDCPAIGASVSAGQLIGKVGSTGAAGGAPHLHFELLNGSTSQILQGVPFDGYPINFDWDHWENLGFARYQSQALKSRGGSGPVTCSFTTYPPQNRWYRISDSTTQLNYTVSGGNPNLVEEIDWPTGNPNSFGQYTDKASGSIQLTAAGQGWHEYEVRARRNTSAAWANSGKWAGGFDSVAPSATRTAGAVPVIWVRGAQTVTYTCSDAHAGFRESAYGFGSVNSGTASIANPRQVNLPTASGEYNLLVKTEDQAGTLADDQDGNTDTHSLGIYRIDNTLPTATISSVTPPTGGSPAGVVIAASGTDAHSGVVRLEVRINGTLIGTINGASGSVIWSTAGYPTNSTITVTAIDGAGNEASTSQGYMLDTSAPDAPGITDEGLITSSWQTLNFGLSMDDPQSGISAYEYKLGTTPGGSELRTAVLVQGVFTSQVVGNLSLPIGVEVYLSVRAKNGVDLWSPWTVSDGITYDPFQFATLTSPSVMGSGGDGFDGIDTRLSGTLGEVLAYNSYSGFWSFADLACLMGSILLEDYVTNQSNVPILVEMWQNGQSVESMVIRTNESGDFAANTTLNGVYDLYASGPHWLRKNLGSVSFSEAVPASANGSLLNGDCNCDNIVDIADYIQLALAFDATPDQPHWDPNADLNGDNIVDIADYAILARNFDLVGE